MSASTAGAPLAAAAEAREPVSPGDRQPGQRRPEKRRLTGYWLLLPGLLWLTVFFVVPLYSLLATSLYDPDGSVLQGYDMDWSFGNYGDALSAYWSPL
ncbi:MAG: transporter permease, partial [Marmoricola sp.]|nr:transporter permease [Marmoricola sp.]